MKPGASDWVKGEEGMTLDIGYRVKTEGSGKAAITFFEGSIVDLQPSTEVKVADLGIKAPTSTTIKIRQETGTTISRVKKLVDPASRYEIETPAAVAAVRGTTMYVCVFKDGTTVVGNIEGAVSVIAQDKEVVIPSGQTATVTPGQPPAQPQSGEIKAIKATSSNMTKNTGDQPAGTPPNIDWWYWELSLKNDNNFGVTILKRWKQLSSPYVNKSEEVKDSFVEAFGTDYIPPTGEIVNRHAWAFFPRQPAPYQATFTMTFYGKDDFGRDVQVSSSQTFTVD